MNEIFIRTMYEKYKTEKYFGAREQLSFIKFGKSNFLITFENFRRRCRDRWTIPKAKHEKMHDSEGRTCEEWFLLQPIRKCESESGIETVFGQRAKLDYQNP